MVFTVIITLTGGHYFTQIKAEDETTALTLTSTHMFTTLEDSIKHIDTTLHVVDDIHKTQQIFEGPE